MIAHSWPGWPASRWGQAAPGYCFMLTKQTSMLMAMSTLSVGTPGNATTADIQDCFKNTFMETLNQLQGSPSHLIP